MKSIFYIGPLRIALVVITITLIWFSFYAEKVTLETEFGLVASAVAPALTFIMLFVVSLDILMSFIGKLDKDAKERLRYWIIIGLDLSMITALIIAWKPFFMRLLES
ncbi:hypothetical protein [Candidatus Nitrosacidococcus tergens]|uniref:Uncharacterized protein n=1 Tax=Candidatus Nitrosacidococcus tergens TaxID=553981 RepID=A0A7G1Q9Y8_9GAMM|nr:hypothetical protein [Candidatus Nitrosacidococcus tergens]CAB1276083.1 conserved membrane protein of unknown function [Candidatus Nitrosacidococcus tergens]